ncbi:MAG TPA: hypothetical protein VGF55_14455 [Gemmataceae bacterium]|jgi:hypothetical protein
MTPTLDDLDRALRAWADQHGIAVANRALGPERSGAFDGPTVTINPIYDPESQAFVLAHSLGSVVVWTLDQARSRTTYDALRDAKRDRDGNRDQFEEALDAWAAHEEAASEYAVGMLAQVGHDWAVPAYTEFARADLDMMLAFHRHGRGPVWRRFFPEWRQRLARGEVVARPYVPRPPPPDFRPVHRIPPQEVFREEAGRPGD